MIGLYLEFLINPKRDRCFLYSFFTKHSNLPLKNKNKEKSVYIIDFGGLKLKKVKLKN